MKKKEAGEIPELYITCSLNVAVLHEKWVCDKGAISFAADGAAVSRSWIPLPARYLSWPGSLHVSMGPVWVLITYTNAQLKKNETGARLFPFEISVMWPPLQGHSVLPLVCFVVLSALCKRKPLRLLLCSGRWPTKSGTDTVEFRNSDLLSRLCCQTETGWGWGHESTQGRLDKVGPSVCQWEWELEAACLHLVAPYIYDSNRL